jgi:Uma2 family endonuclease
MLPHMEERQVRTTRAAVIASLYDVPGKAEIVRGAIVRMSPTGALHGRAVGAIFSSLRAYAERIGSGTALGDNVGFLVNLPHRWSFCPDASFHIGPDTGEEFLDRAPILAIEVRSKAEYGNAAEKRMAAKRADYFAAGSEIVWDVDVLRDGIVRVFRRTAPDTPTEYRRGQIAEAEPAVPGWTMAVDELFTIAASQPAAAPR